MDIAYSNYMNLAHLIVMQVLQAVWLFNDREGNSVMFYKINKYLSVLKIIRWEQKL